jgi:hypothetical protein
MNQVISNYDELSNTLYVSFAPGEKATVETIPITTLERELVP